MKTQVSNRNWYRIGLQSIIIILQAYMVARIFMDRNYLADFEAYCPFGGMQALASFFVTNSLACSMTESQIFMGIVLLVGVVLTSKLFCSYICPIGTFTEWLGKIGDRLSMKYTISGLADRILRSLKYIILFLTFYFTVSSSELFCKEYDPFYAVFTWFGHDVNLILAVIAIIVTILGSIFIRQFWSKYLCPLGAAANIFVYAESVLAIAALYFILRWIGLEISWIWLAGGIIFMAMLFESIKRTGWNFPFIKITRNENRCTHCLECDLSCPMGIQLSQKETIDHIDCHLCGDCIKSCPEREVLQINKKEMRWLPSSLTLLLVTIGLTLAATVELPTINLRWGRGPLLDNAEVYVQSGLKSVKCFGSATSFATRMKKVPGVLGVEAYVKTHTVKIFFNPAQITSEQIRKSIFSPAQTLLRSAKSGKIARVNLAVDKLFDSYDHFYLTKLLAQDEGILGFSSQYGEPVHLSIYFDPAQTDPDSIKKLIESRELTYSLRNRSYTVDLNFTAGILPDSILFLTNNQFKEAMFNPYRLEFNDFSQYDSSRIAVYRIAMPQAMNPKFKRFYQYLAAHLSMDSAIIKFETVYRDEPFAQVYFLRDKIPEKEIYNALDKDTLTFMYSTGKKGQIRNPFRFREEGFVINQQEKSGNSKK